MNWIPFLYLTNGTKIISMTVPMSVEMAVPVTTSLWQQLLFTRLCCSNIPIFPSLDHPNASHIDNLCSYILMIKSWVLAGPFNSVADAICCLPSSHAGIHVHGKCPRQIDCRLSSLGDSLFCHAHYNPVYILPDKYLINSNAPGFPT